jgi:hypothetical protein
VSSERTEIIPADYMRDSYGYKVYDIADGAGEWMKTSPDAHNAYVQAVDDKFNGKVKPLIRFLKAWKYFRDVPVSSFYLELRVAKYAVGESAIVYDIDVQRILKMLWDCRSPACRTRWGSRAIFPPAPQTSAGKPGCLDWRRRLRGRRRPATLHAGKTFLKPSTTGGFCTTTRFQLTIANERHRQIAE